MIVVVALAWAAPAFAQERGTVEFGGFASAATFDKSLTLNSGFGEGGRVGIFLDPSWSFEAEDGEMRATRTLGLQSVNVGILSTRLTFVPVKRGVLSLLVGGGFGAGTETNFMHTYGVNALVGAKIALNNTMAIRVDGIVDWLANNSWETYKSVHLGLVLYRPFFAPTRVVMVQAPAPAPIVLPAPAMMQRPDSVSPEEQARLRAVEVRYRALRDSLAQVRQPSAAPPMSAAAVATMEEKIHFATDKSDLTPAAMEILDSKVQVFLANPSMRISIVGNTDERASDAYNMGLGERRSAAAKAYLVSKGIDPARIQITTDGKRDPTATGTSSNAEATNRRDEFRLIIVLDPKSPML